LLVYSKHEDTPNDLTDEQRKKYMTYVHRFKGDVRNAEEIHRYL